MPYREYYVQTGSLIRICYVAQEGLPKWCSGKESPVNAGDAGSVPGWRRSLGAGNSDQLHYSCLENSVDRGAWWATVHGVLKSQK